MDGQIYSEDYSTNPMEDMEGDTTSIPELVKKFDQFNIKYSSVTI